MGNCCCSSSEASSAVVPVTVDVPVIIPPNNETPKNIAFVFIKPHANTKQVQELVTKVFNENSITIVKEGELTGEQIDAGKLIDQHYYAIGK